MTTQPHGARLVFQLGVTAIVTLLGCVLILHPPSLVAGIIPFPAEAEKFNRWISLGCLLAGGLTAAHLLLAYTFHFIEIRPEGIVIHQGWAVRRADSILWAHIKDIDTSATLCEALVGTGAIHLTTAVRDQRAQIKVRWLPDHNILADTLRAKMTDPDNAVRQVSIL